MLSKCTVYGISNHPQNTLLTQGKLLMYVRLYTELQVSCKSRECPVNCSTLSCKIIDRGWQLRTNVCICHCILSFIKNGCVGIGEVRTYVRTWGQSILFLPLEESLCLLTMDLLTNVCTSLWPCCSHHVWIWSRVVACVRVYCEGEASASPWYCTLVQHNGHLGMECMLH